MSLNVTEFKWRKIFSLPFRGSRPGLETEKISSPDTSNQSSGKVGSGGGKVVRATVS